MGDRLCEGRVAIVTGAGRGIGREYALQLAAHGAKVVVNDLGGARDGSPGNEDEQPAEAVVREIRARGGEAVANLESCSSWAAAKRMVDQAVDTFGSLDCVVNNAGILRDRMLTNMTEEEWDAVINVHLKGTFAPTHHAAVYWKSRRPLPGGRIPTSTTRHRPAPCTPPCRPDSVTPRTTRPGRNSFRPG